MRPLTHRFPLEVYVGSQEALVQRLNRTEVVAERRLGKVTVALHDLPQSVHLCLEPASPVSQASRQGSVSRTSCREMVSGLLMMIHVTVSKQPGTVMEPSYVMKEAASPTKAFTDNEGIGTVCPS